MQIQNIVFNGGIRTKVSDYLLEPSQAVSCVNVDTEKGSIYPLNGWRLVDDISGYHATDFGGAKIANTDIEDDRCYVRFANQLYFTTGTYGSYGLMKLNSSYAVVNATAPTVTAYGTITLTPVADGALTGSYAYRYTVVDEDGIESAPSQIFYVASLANQSVDISIAADTVNETVSKRRIYRTGGSNPTYNLIAEIDDAVAPYTFSDNTLDIDVSRVELTTFSDYAPPQDITNLVENNGTFFASLGDRVHFSRSGQPEYWSGLDFVTLHAPCTGLGVFRGNIVAFTSNDAYIISGYSRDDIALERLPFQEGCMHHHNISAIEDKLVWTSNNGICSFDGSRITVLTRELLDWKNSAAVSEETFDSFDSTFDSNLGSNILYGTGVRGKYYGVTTDYLYVVDINSGIVISNVQLDGIQSVFYNETENEVEAVVLKDTGEYESYTFDTNEEVIMEGRWKSGRMMGQEGYAVTKDFRKMSFSDTPKWVRVFIDGKKMLYIENTREFHLPPASIGSSLQFEISTKREIRSLKIQYGVMK